MKKTAVRSSNIELLRIFAMVMILAHHIGVHSGFNLSADFPIINKAWLQFIQMGGKIGVNIFVLISGYFLITAESLKYDKVIKLWLQLVTYSLVMFALFVFLEKVPFSKEGLLHCFSPITDATWWFASTYFVLFLLSPYLNIGLRAMSRSTYRRLLLLLTFCWCVIPTFSKGTWQGSALLWFIYLYALAGYFRLHADLKAIKSAKCFLCAALMILLTYFLAIGLDRLGVKSVFNPFSSEYFFDMQTLPTLLISVTLFLGFLVLDIGTSPLINFVSSATFAVYLIHDYEPMRSLLWKTIFRNQQFIYRRLLIPYTVLQILLVFAICAVIELLRMYIIERTYMKLLTPALRNAATVTKKFSSAKIFDKFKKHF